MIRQSVLVAHVKGSVKGANQIQSVVKKRTAVMGLGENDYMSYLLGQ